MEGDRVTTRERRMAFTTYEIDPVHTFLGFAVRYLAIAKVQGRFTRFAGTLEIDWSDLVRSSAHLGIETASIETGHAERDEHLRSRDFLDAGRFPEMVFHSAELIPRTGAVFDLSGRLMLRGVTKRVALQVEYGGKATDPNGVNRVGILARGTIDRRDFGLAWNRPMEGGVVMVGHDVELDLAIQGVWRAG
jgi:polyisoprenoid-binding protein YceI